MTVHRVRNPNDFAAALPLPDSNPLVVFSFITRGCRACKYASHAFARLSNDFGSHVRFFEMDVSERQNQLLGKRLGIDAVPAFQFYTFKKDGLENGVGVLDEFVGPRTVGKVRERVAQYLEGGLDLSDYVFEDVY
ncbi:Thioredoxin [Gracilaria domingensis]|nr:Thioredoxin [Gracilaria domingensis]